MIAMDITEILHPEFIGLFQAYTQTIEVETRRDAIGYVRTPKGLAALHARENLVLAAQLPPCHIKSLLELFDPVFSKSAFSAEVKP